MSDHARNIKDFIKGGIPVYSAFETQTALEITTGELTKPIPPMKKKKIGNFTVTPFNVPHDTDIECYGYLIEHEEIGKLLFMTDLEYCPYNFSKWNINHIICEANYSKDFINPEDANRNRVLQTHMELNTTLDFIKVNKNPMLRNVILCHLSNENASAEDFIKLAENAVDCPVYVAEKGLQVNMDLVPF